MSSPSPAQLDAALRTALTEAEKFVGATAPNPPVGATVLDGEGRILAVGAHKKAGAPHAEVEAIEECRRLGLLQQARALVVTLEPCNHTGRTPPCSLAILKTPVRHVFIGARDPNLSVPGGGAERLELAGLEVGFAEGELANRSSELIAPFRRWIQNGLPFVTIKVARNREGGMIPPAGCKTFTSPASLKLAHELRKRADAIITGSGTVLADQPEFTVRHVPDWPGKNRWLVILDRRGRVPADYVRAAELRGFRVVRHLELEQALWFLGENQCLEALVEAGPTLTQDVLQSGFWDRHVVITQASPEQPADQVDVYRNY